MRKIKTLVLGILAFSTLGFFPDAAMGCSTECGGCRKDNIKNHPDWLAFVNAMQAKGLGPISCFRTRKCQQKLVNCYGRGRAAAAGTSNHEGSRVATDFSGKTGAARVARAEYKKFIKGPTGELWHGNGKCGVGSLHISNSASENKCGTSRYTGPKSKPVKEYRQKNQGRPSKVRGQQKYNRQQPKRQNRKYHRPVEQWWERIFTGGYGA